MAPTSTSKPLRGLCRLPTSATAAATIERLSQADAEQHHSVWNVKTGFHNHASHHLLAAYDLGASAELLERIYAHHDSHETLPIDLAGTPDEAEVASKTVDETNVYEHLGDVAAYKAYFAFFREQIGRHGVRGTVERFFLSDDANAGDRKVFLRLVAAGVLHPFIQLGYGLEFGSDLVIAQGLAMACTHGNTRGGYFPDMDAKLAPPSSSEAKLPLFGVLAELYKSDKIVPPRYEPDLTINQRYQKIADAKNDCLPELVRLCGRWDIDDAGDDAHFAARVAELQLFGAVAACATTRPGYEPRVDFFLMHLLTSSLFLPSYMAAFPEPATRALLLRAYVRIALGLLVERGKPALHLAHLMSQSETPQPARSVEQRHVHPKGLAPNLSAVGAAPWQHIVTSSFAHPDSHQIKAIRSLVYLAQHAGDTPAGGFAGADLLGGGDRLDGSAFLRAAGVIMRATGWVGDGDEPGEWDRSNLGYDEAWQK